MLRSFKIFASGLYARADCNPFFIFLSIFSTPFFYILLMLPKGRRPLFGTLSVQRIGHFGADFLIRYCELLSSIYGQRPVLHYLSKRNCCNLFLLELCRRKLSTSVISRLFIIFPSTIKHLDSLFLPSPGSLDGKDSMDLRGITYNMQLDLFTSNEDIQAKKWLLRHGWRPGQRIVYLLNRDSRYMESISNFDFSYHDYRNYSVSTLKDTIDWLIHEKGCFVIRMGKCSHEPANVRHPSFVDYPFCRDQSELVEIWLFANASFFVSCGTGPDNFSAYSGIPGVLINFIPFHYAPTYMGVVVSPKKLYSKVTGKLLDSNEMIRNGFFRSEEYLYNDIEPICLTAFEILDNVKLAWSLYIDSVAPSQDLLDQKQQFLTLTSHCICKERFIHPKFFVNSYL